LAADFLQLSSNPGPHTRPYLATRICHTCIYVYYRLTISPRWARRGGWGFAKCEGLPTVQQGREGHSRIDGQGSSGKWEWVLESSSSLNIHQRPCRSSAVIRSIPYSITMWSKMPITASFYMRRIGQGKYMRELSAPCPGLRMTTSFRLDATERKVWHHSAI
jgi:hypothetical protein